MRKLFNRTETIDFKTFCKGGSPEYIEAKQKLNDLYLKHKNGYHNFVEFGPSNFAESSIFGRNSKHHNLTAYSLYINPLAFFDLHFVLAAGAVVLVAIIEKKLANNGIVGIAAALSGIMQIALPVTAFVAILILISKVGVFL